MLGAGRAVDTVRATGVAPLGVEEALAVVAVVVVTRYAFLSPLCALYAHKCESLHQAVSL